MKYLLITGAISFLGFMLFPSISDGIKPFETVSDSRIMATNHSASIKICESFLKKNKAYNQKIFFYVDMKIPSSKHRFFVYDNFAKKSIDKGNCAHGSGSDSETGDLTFSNVPNSYQTSLGKYKVGKKYTGSFGTSFKLHGLDKTNNKAFERFVVLHGYEGVPEEEQEEPITLSLGCPMVAPLFLKSLEKIIINSKSPILLYIFY